jgi:UDP-glucose 4-epimerase
VLDNFLVGKMENLADVANHPNLTIMRGDVTDRADVERAFRDCRVVIHLAVIDLRYSIKDPFLTNHVITTGTLTCLDAARRNKVDLFLNVSSAEVYGDITYFPVDENHPYFPTNPYAAAKVAQDMYVYSYGRTYGLPWTTIRFFSMYGPKSHWQSYRGEVIPKMIVRAMGNQPLVIFGDGSQTRDFVYIEDAARALIAMGENPASRGHIVQFCTSRETSILQVAELICRNFGLDPRKAIQKQPWRPADIKRMSGTNHLCSDMLGIIPTIPIDEGLRRTIAWYRALPYTPEELLSQEVLRNWE